MEKAVNLYAILYNFGHPETREMRRALSYILLLLAAASMHQSVQAQADTTDARYNVLDSILQDTNNRPTPTPPSKRRRVEIVNADRHLYSSAGRPVRSFIGNVHLRQDTTDFYCDTAYHYTDSNMLYAQSNVKIVLKDSLSITSDRLEYDANMGIADLFGNIVMKNRSTELRTPRMTFYRKEDYGKYFQGGVLYDGENELRSQSGYYFTEDDLAFFRGNVVLVNPKYTLQTDTLGYDTHSESAIFAAPTLIIDKDDNTIYTERGFYDTKMNMAFFYKNPFLQDSTYRLAADTIYYDRELDFGRAIGNLELSKTDSSITVYGQYGEFKQFESVSYLTDSAYALQIMDNDTLYVFADTLLAYQDSILDEETDTLRPNNILFAYYDVVFFMNDLQGRTDSMVYFLDDSLIYFYKEPMLWSDKTQVIGDTVKVFLANEQVDSMAIGKKGLIVTEEDTVGFNQVKGIWILTKFVDNKLNRMYVKGNSESIYFAKEEDSTYSGMNQARCNEMVVRFEDNEVSRISFIDQAEGTFSPMHAIVFEKNQLDGFRWEPEKRPVKPVGIFGEQSKDRFNESKFRDSILKHGAVIDSTYEISRRDSLHQQELPPELADSMKARRGELGNSAIPLPGDPTEVEAEDEKKKKQKKEKKVKKANAEKLMKKAQRKAEKELKRQAKQEKKLRRKKMRNDPDEILKSVDPKVGMSDKQIRMMRKAEKRRQKAEAKKKKKGSK